MEDINSILSKVGLKCTKQRISVMQVLSDADAPLTVENIYDKVRFRPFTELRKSCVKRV